MADTGYMRRALELAAAAEGEVSPRPPVGALIVDRQGRVAGEGATEPSPGPHAEVVALRRAGPRAAGATLYTSLEPCSHTGDTPPCSQALVAAGVRRVVVGMRDPNPLVRGRGIRALRAAGIEVRVGVLRAQARELIAGFTRWVTTGRPLLTLKMASTLDGRVAAPDGTSRWITGPKARHEVHELRARVDGILVGAGTIAADDPSLDVRLPGYTGSQPRPIVADASGRTPPTARIFAPGRRPIVLSTAGVGATQRRSWEDAGARVLVLPAAEDGVDPDAALAALGELGLCHVLLEGGPALAGAFVAAGLVGRYRLYLAPKLLGPDALALLGTGVKTLDEAWNLQIKHVVRVGADIRIDAIPGEAR